MSRTSWVLFGLLALSAGLGCGDDDAGEPARSRVDAGAKNDARARSRDGGPRVRDAGNGSDGGHADSVVQRDAQIPADAGAEARADAAQAPSCNTGDPCGDAAAPAVCTSRTLAAHNDLAATPVTLLLLFDRSGSMAEAWSGKTRWEAAGDAVLQGLATLQRGSRAGAFFFPTSDPNAPRVCVDPSGVACTFVPLFVMGGTCGVGKLADPDQIAFGPAAGFLAAFAARPNGVPRHAPVPGSFTPLKEALLQARSALTEDPPPGKAVVVIVSDGDANCEWDAAVAREVVAGWQARGIDTHALALNSATSVALGDLASAGGTTVRSPSDGAALAVELQQIVERAQGGLPSCSVALAAAGNDALQLIVELNGQRYAVAGDLGDGAGWHVNTARDSVELSGALCTAARQGRFSALAIEAGCVDLPALPASAITP